MTSAYTLINTDTKKWWYHQQLREQGAHEEARKRERENIKSTIRTFREAQKYSVAHMFVGKGGMSFHYSPNSRISGGNIPFYIAMCHKFDIPVIDTRHLSIEKSLETIKIPMISDTPDDPPYTWISYASMNYIFDRYRKLGAIIT